MIFKRYSKILLFFFIVFTLVYRVNATEIKPVRLYADSLKERSVTLSLPWKYHPGDNPEWALLSFDDSDWDTIRTELRYDDKSFEKWKGIGWFRREIIIDSALINKPVALIISHFGASEIYLNGELVHKFGRVSANSDSEEVYLPRRIPVVLQFNTDTVYVLAIRYSNHKSIADKDWYNKWLSYAGFKLTLRDINDSFFSFIQSEGLAQAVNMGIAAIFLSLSVLYILLFFFYSMKRENLYYSLFTFFISITFASGMLGRFINSNLGLFIGLRLFSTLAIIWVFPAYLGFLYSIFYKKMPKQFWGFIIFAVLLSTGMIFFNISDDLMQGFYLGYMILTSLEGLRTIIVAIKQNREHSWVIGAGVIVFFIFIVTLFVIGLLGMGNINSLIGIILFFIGILSLPLSMSIYLARDIASTNKNLIKQLETVKELSKKELEQKLRAQKAEAENERKTKELEEARQLQLSMLPKELPELPNLDIAVYMKTATEVGGDYYDFHLGNDGTLTCVIGDATGHGLKAGTMVTATKSLFNTYASNDDIIKTLHDFSHAIKGMKMHLLSMCLSIVKIKDGKLKITAAGMPPALLYRTREKRVEELILKGMPLGTFDNFPYQLKETDFNSGDTLLLLSDGLPELFNENMEMFGYERVTEEFVRVAGKSPDEIIAHLKEAGSRWINGTDPGDDMTFVVIKVK